MFVYFHSARQRLRRAWRNEAAELRSISRIAETIKPPRQADYASGGIYDPLFAGLSADAASIRVAICSRPYLRPRFA